MDLSTSLKNDNNETIKGFAIIGQNSAGKTHNMNKLFEELIELIGYAAKGLALGLRPRFYEKTEIEVK